MASNTPPLQAATLPELAVDGRPNAELARDLAWLEIEEDTQGLMRLQAGFIAMGPRPGARDEQLRWLDGQVLDFGATLVVSLGPSDARRPVFEGRVSALELALAQGRSPELLCLAEDALMDLRLTRRFRTYENVSDAELLQQVAAQHGLAAQAALDGPSWPVVQQWNQSDLAFLRERARRLAAEVWVQDGTLHLAAREQRQGDALTLVQGGTLMQVRLRADLAHQRSAVVVGGFDDGQQEAIDEEAGAAVVAAEAQGHVHGAQVLERAFGARTSHRVRDVPLQGSHARALARAALQARARRFVTVAGIADGNARLRVGTRLRLERVGGMFEGDGYHVTRACHRFDPDAGYRTEFEAERPWIGDLS